MGTELLFESRLTYHVLRQDGADESGPFLTLRLELIDGPMIYASDAAIINKSAWTMVIRKRGPAGHAGPHVLGSVRYLAGEGKSTCVIDVYQAPERFAALLDMFKGGHASEITVIVAGLGEKSDYSKDWNTALDTTIAVQSICFEFPLPQSEA